MTLAEQWRQEGRQEGRQETETMIVLKLLQSDMDIGQVTQLTGLSKNEIERLIKIKIMTLPEQYRQEGLQEGRQEAEKVIAIKLLQNGMDVGQIAQLTELSKNEIEKLKQQIQ